MTGPGDGHIGGPARVPPADRTTSASSFWAEPRVAQPPGRGWRDWALVAVLVLWAVLEGVFRADLAWRPVALVLAAAPVFALLWRRTNPLVVVAVVFGAQVAADVATWLGAGTSLVLYAGAYVVLVPYSLCRWGAGREAVIGLTIILGAHFLRESLNPTGVTDALIGSAFLLFPAALGASVRYRTNLRLREIEQVKLREREQLARELHDTVAHHVSAIAIQAQAGRALAASDPDRALQTLDVIEAAASRTLAEMRTMVGVLRRDRESDPAPQRGVADIERLAGGAGDLRVAVELSGDLDDLRPSVGAGLYRLAQESITNAVRHARHASRITVTVTGDRDRVRLTVGDDGDGSSAGRTSSGYGLVGMTERATLLGGTLQAGPSPEGGWTVSAMLPKGGSIT